LGRARRGLLNQRGTPEIEAYHPGISCRVTVCLFGHGSFSQFLIYDQGMQNQSVILYNGGLLVVGANHDVYGHFIQP
jgi:hypothetical protein